MPPCFLGRGCYEGDYAYDIGKVKQESRIRREKATTSDSTWSFSLLFATVNLCCCTHSSTPRCLYSTVTESPPPLFDIPLLIAYLCHIVFCVISSLFLLSALGRGRCYSLLTTTPTTSTTTAAVTMVITSSPGELRLRRGARADCSNKSNSRHMTGRCCSTSSSREGDDDLCMANARALAYSCRGQCCACKRTSMIPCSGSNQDRNEWNRQQLTLATLGYPLLGLCVSGGRQRHGRGSDMVVVATSKGSIG